MLMDPDFQIRLLISDRMVLILDDNSETAALVWNEIGN